MLKIGLGYINTVKILGNKLNALTQMLGKLHIKHLQSKGFFKMRSCRAAGQTTIPILLRPMESRVAPSRFESWFTENGKRIAMEKVSSKSKPTGQVTAESAV